MINTIKDAKILVSSTIEMMEELPIDRVEKYYRQSMEFLGRPIDKDTVFEINHAKLEEMVRGIRNGIILFDMATLEKFYNKIKLEVASSIS